MYREAIYQKTITAQNPPSSLPAFRENRAHIVALAIQASRYPLPGFCADVPWSADHETDLADVVIVSGEDLQSEGKLDAALDHYLAAERILLHFRQLWPGSTEPIRTEVRLCEDLIYSARRKASRQRACSRRSRISRNYGELRQPFATKSNMSTSRTFTF